MKVARDKGVKCYMGETLDVASRLVNAAKESEPEATHIVWLQGLLYFLDLVLTKDLVRFGLENDSDYVRCVDGTCKHWLGQFVKIKALKRVIELAVQQSEDEAAWNLARPFAFIRKNENLFKSGLFEELPDYTQSQLKEMRRVAASIHIGGERADHSERSASTGDVSIGRYREILEEIPPGATVLDIACGNGYGSNLISGRASKVYGVDITLEVVERAKVQFGSKAEFIHGSGTNIPIDNDSVDVVVSIGTVEHIKEDELFVRELSRVLKLGGKAIIYTPQNRMGDIPTWPWHEREYSIESLESLFSKCFCVSKIWGWQNGQVTQNDPRGDGTYIFLVNE